ncbi:MAG: PHB depolymerase family esterase [Flavobacteriales bacterium]|nr:PHB depolymerase family esterase [Flavobacteriales bacterium]MCB9174365.1 PHB depolymerase family esterase [Flavobacteriales bacterium]
MLKHFLLIIYLFTNLYSSAQHLLTQIEDFGINKGNLKMYAYIPNNLESVEKIPLVFVLHGCTQSAEQISNETGWNKLADSLKFIVVYPEQRQINNATKCFNFFIGFKAKKDKGEVASIKQMIDYCFTNYNIDSSMVFITGMSAGGGMSNALLNAYPTLFNAGALFAAPSNLFEHNTDSPEKQPRIVIIQGNDDQIVPKKNSDALISHWLIKHQLDSTSVEEIPNYLENPLLKAQFYSNKNKEVKIISILANDVKHKLLIHSGEAINEGGVMDYHTQDINFHSTYWVATFFGLTTN